MPPSLDSVNFYTKLLTAMVLLLNIGLLVAVPMALKYARFTCAMDPNRKGGEMWKGAKRGIVALILLVVVMNGVTVYANQRMVSAAQDLAAEFPPDSAAGLAQGMIR